MDPPRRPERPTVLVDLAEQGANPPRMPDNNGNRHLLVLRHNGVLLFWPTFEQWQQAVILELIFRDLQNPPDDND